VSCQGRNTQGVTLIRLTNDEHLVGIERVVEDDEVDIDIDEIDEADGAVVDQAPSDGDESPDIAETDTE
jgi:DNA gyrase subunit A